jgi:histidine triad (HIT) family protein
MDCIFCKIVAGQIPSEIAYRDEKVIAFRDIHPEAPIHLLIIPTEHITSLVDITTEKQAGLVGHLALVANKLAKQMGIAESGYRLVINYGPDGGQEVPHLHMHLLGGKRLVMRMG